MGIDETILWMMQPDTISSISLVDSYIILYHQHDIWFGPNRMIFHHEKLGQEPTIHGGLSPEIP